MISFPAGTEMFQFPAFALSTLCVQEESTCPGPFTCHAAVAPEDKSSSSEAVGQIKNPSGGLPHSEIPGSKGALASPGLIAECRVLHRLLPPRHPPNALLALDPIRKKTGPLVRGRTPPARVLLAPVSEVFDPGHPLGRRKDPAARSAGRSCDRRRPDLAVSVLRLGKTAIGATLPKVRRRPPPHLADAR